ncbi:MAG TPA: transglycosylase SLT domain-containing protein [Caulobacteraceae bacterium]|nr:transglycosylase SLT domain-containing protein [Caulobacteraceae bacterium]
MSVQSISGVVEAAIQRASSATGVDFGFLMGAARRESGYDPTARAKTSSAAGLFQFIDQTWLATLKRHGAKYGYARYAELIQQAPNGRLYVPGAQARAAVMDLRLDPHAAALMAGELTADHAAYLRGRVGREPTAGELYIAHVLGPQGSARLIDAVRATPGAGAAALFPEAAAANRAIFYPGGRTASVAEVYANLTAGPGGPPPIQAPRTISQGFIQYAGARQSELAAEQDAVVALVLRGPEGEDDAGAGGRAATGLFSAAMLRALSEAESQDRTT